MDFYAPIKLGFIELISIHYLVYCVCFLRFCLEATLNPPSENITCCGCWRSTQEKVFIKDL